jgi:hypothetical protein
MSVRSTCLEIVAVLLLLAASSTTLAQQPCRGCCLLDPAIRHTNGMPIASSEPRRNSSVTWTCNPDKLGYCGGKYYLPCCDSVRCGPMLDAYRGCYTPVQLRGYKTFIGTVCPPGEAAMTMDGFEPVGMTTLGAVPNNYMTPGGAPGMGRGLGGESPRVSPMGFTGN